MGRSFSASAGKNVRRAGLDAAIQGSLTRSANLSAIVQGEFLKTAGLIGDVSLYAVYEMLAGLNAVVTPSTLILGLTSYWKLDGNSTDSAGVGSATDTAITYSVGNGKISQGAGLNGTSSKIVITPASSYKPTQVTVAAWVKTTNAGSYQTIFASSYQDGTAVSGFELRKNNANKLELVIGKNTNLTQGSGYQFCTSNTLINTGGWFHVVGTYDGTNMKIYVDGVLETTTAFAGPMAYSASTTTQIGVKNVSGADNSYWNGSLDEVCVWNRVLTAAEVTELHNKRVGNQYPFGNYAATTSGLLGYWKLDGNSTDSLALNNGTDTNITYSVGNGKINQGAGFDGSSSYISLGSGIALDSSNWTMAFWINPSNVTAAYRRVLSYYGNGPTVQMAVTSGEIRLVHAGTNDWSSGQYFIPSVWQHVVMTRSNTNLALYVNGTQVASTANFTTAYTADTSIRIGTSTAFAEYVVGAMDEVGLWSRALTADEVLALHNKTVGNQHPFTTPTAPTTTALAGYWKLDGNSNDSLGVSNGTDTGITYGTGVIGSAAQFVPASTSMISCGTNSALEVQKDDFTLMAWVKSTAKTQNYQSWILRVTGANKPQYRMGFKLMTNQWGLTWYNGSGYVDEWVTTADIADGVWAHVAVSRVGNSLRFYKNGVLVTSMATVPMTMQTGSATFMIGRNVEDNSYFNGSIDEVGVWGRALSDAEITYIYNSGAGRQYPF